MITNFEKYTEQAEAVIRQSYHEARRLNHDYIATEHLLLALLTQPNTLAMRCLKSLGVDLADLQKSIEFMAGHGLGASEEPALTGSSNKALKLADKQANQLGHQLIGVEDLLLGLIAEGEGLAAGALESRTITIENLKAQIKTLSSQSFTSPSSKALLEKDVPSPPTNLANDYQQEIEQAIQILAGSTANNVLFLHKSKFSSTMLLQELLQRQKSGDLPEPLRQKRWLKLDPDSLLTTSQVEDFFEQFHKDKEKSNVILVIKNFHKLLQPYLNIANPLKTALSQTSLQVVATITLDGYGLYISDDASINIRFKIAGLGEPTVEETTMMLENSKIACEEHYGVRYTDQTMTTAVKLANKYLKGDSPLVVNAFTLLKRTTEQVVKRELGDQPETEVILDELTEQTEDALLSGDKDLLEKHNDEIFELIVELEDERPQLNVTEKDVAETLAAVWLHLPPEQVELD